MVIDHSHAKKLQNLFAGNSKNETAVEGTVGTTRTADTANNLGFQSSNNSNSVKGSVVQKIAINKPPRDASVTKNRPSTTSSAAFRFYHYQNGRSRDPHHTNGRSQSTSGQDLQAAHNLIVSQSVERNQISHSRHHASYHNQESKKLTKGSLDAY